MLTDNPVLLTDSYKISHWLMYPEGTTGVFSYFESRNGAKWNRTLFFGLQYILETDLVGVFVTQEDIDEAEGVLGIHFHNPKVFNREGWVHIVKEHGGKLSLRIKAVPEGTRVPVSNILMSIENTCHECAWVTNYVEDILTHVWYPSTVATKSRAIKDMLLEFLEETGTPEAVDYMLQDFGYRGAAMNEAAMIGGTGHLVNFKGTDTLVALATAIDYYDADVNDTGFSVPACYDDQTEILTESGFVPFPDLTNDTRVAQYHEDGTISFVLPTNHHEYDYQDDLVSFTTDTGYVDLVVTPNHKMVTKDHNGIRTFEAASDQRSDRYTQGNRIIVAGNGQGDDTLTPLEKIAIAFQADGSYPSHADDYDGSRSGTFPVRFQLKKQRKKNRLERLCVEAGVEFYRSDYENGYSSFWLKIPHRLSKTLDWVTLNHSATWAEEFLYEVSRWDGSVDPNRPNNIAYSSSIESNVDVVQAVAAICGRRGQKGVHIDQREDRRPQYTLNVNVKSEVGGQNVRKALIPYEGRVYCVSVPTKMLVVRRNGRVAVCGNSEHSGMTSLGREGEYEILDHLLDTFEEGILSVVADSYDIYAFTEALIERRERIVAREGVFVERPDSPTPTHSSPEDLVLYLVERLWEGFGGVVNDKGYKVLDPHIRVLWGDGIDEDGVWKILNTLKFHGFSADNIACFGMGGGLLQRLNRDTQRFAFKCSAQERDGKWIDVQKDPLDASKKSKAGRLKLIDTGDGGFATVREDEPGENLLVTVFEDGEMVNTTDFAAVRERSNA